MSEFIDITNPSDITFRCQKCDFTRTLPQTGAVLWLEKNDWKNPIHVLDSGEMLPFTRDGDRWSPTPANPRLERQDPDRGPA